MSILKRQTRISLFTVYTDAQCDVVLPLVVLVDLIIVKLVDLRERMAASYLDKINPSLGYSESGKPV